MKYPSFISISLCLFLLLACKAKGKKGDTIASTPEELQKKTSELIKNFIGKAIAGSHHPDDSTIILGQPEFGKFLYENKSFQPLWSQKEEWLPVGDSLFSFIESSQLFGLFPEDYHVQ